jgi:hypothetical protein
VREPPDSDGPPDLDGLLHALRDEADRRRAAGSYPPGLEDELDHLGRILGGDPLPGYDRLRRRLEALCRLPPLDAGRIEASSRLPLGALVHRLVGRVVARQTRGILQQVQQRHDATVELLVALVESLGGADSHVHADLVGLLDAVLDRLASYEQAPAGAGPAAAELHRRVAALEAAEAQRQAPPWPGPPVPVTGRAELERHLGGGRPVLELRGDGPPGADPLGALAAAGDASLGGVLAARLVEGLAPHQVYELVLVSFDKLRPGGRLVIEGANPRSLAGIAEGTAGIPGRDRLVDPGYLRWLCQAVGFSETGAAGYGANGQATLGDRDEQGAPPLYVVWAAR